MTLARQPAPFLRPFVKMLWATDEAAREGTSRAAREHVLPTAAAHIVFRLCDVPLRLFDDERDPVGRVIGDAVIGGPRASFYVRDVSRPVSSVGAQLHAGAVETLLGVPADALAGHHTLLEDLWPVAREWREQLYEARTAARRLDVLESLLASRLPRVRGVHPAVAEALSRFAQTDDVASVVAATGYSHRGLIAIFRRAVGLTPKLYCRVLRFQRVIARAGTRGWTELALEGGYSDQAHLIREFRELAGVTPGAYGRAAPVSSNHVPIAEVNFIQDAELQGTHSRRGTRKETAQ